MATASPVSLTSRSAKTTSHLVLSLCPHLGPQNPISHPQLTDHPEQKRRQGIRQGFDRLCEVVPGLQGQGRSEGHVLNETVRQALALIEERKRLVKELEDRGIDVPEQLKAWVASPPQ